MFLENDMCWTLKHQKLCILDVFKAWDYARTISRSKKLHIACPKVNIGTKNNIFGTFLKTMYVCASCMYAVCINVCSMHYMYVLYVCIMCMYYMYVLHVCMICMYDMYAIYV